MSYYNKLKNTQICGPLDVVDDPTIGGPLASVTCTRGGTFGGLLTAPSMQTSYINPQGVTAVSADTVLPSTISNGSLVLIEAGGITVTLPTPMAGYCLYFMYDSTIGILGFGNATIAYTGGLSYESPIGNFNTNVNTFAMVPNSSFVAISNGTVWYLIANSGLLDSVAGLGLLAKLNSSISTTGTGPYTFTIASGNSWIFNGLLTAGGGFTVSSGTVTFPAASISLSALNGLFSTSHSWTALNTFTTGLTISAGGLTVSAGTVTFPAGTIATSALANASLQWVDISSSLTSLLNAKGNLTGGNTWSGNQTYTGGVTISSTSGLNVTTGSVAFPAASIANAALASGSLTTANTWSALATFNAGVSVGTGGWLTVSSTADFLGAVQCTNGMSVTAGAVSFPSASIANSALASGALTTANSWTALNTFTSGLTVSAGSVSLPAGSIANSALANTAISSGYVDATSSIQTQLNNCVSASANTTYTGHNTHAQTGQEDFLGNTDFIPGTGCSVSFSNAILFTNMPQLPICYGLINWNGTSYTLNRPTAWNNNIGTITRLGTGNVRITANTNSFAPISGTIFLQVGTTAPGGSNIPVAYVTGWHGGSSTAGDYPYVDIIMNNLGVGGLPATDYPFSIYFC